MTASSDPQHRLQALLGGHGLGPLRQRLRQACAQTAPGQVLASLRLSALAPHEAEALQALMGRPPRPTRSMRVDLAGLDALLRHAGLADGLHSALEALDGPIVSRHSLQAEAAGWAALAQSAPHAALRALLAEPRALGLLKRLGAGDTDQARRLCARAASVLQALPAAGLPRARLAASGLGDAHALDDGQPTATLVLAALRREAAEADAETSRTLWASQGVAVNELARPVLTLNLPTSGSGSGSNFDTDTDTDHDHDHKVAASALASRDTRACCATSAHPAGEPRYWSLRQLLRQPPRWPVAGRGIFVCENPNLLALAADALGPRCAPLVCTDGMPAAAQRTLLQQLRAAGAQLHYHGDFDWAGLAIGNHMVLAHGALPWRFGLSDYRQALRHAGLDRAALAGRPLGAVWDDALAPAMAASGTAVPEEALFDSLRGDLTQGP